MEQDNKYFKESLNRFYGKDLEKLEKDIDYLWDAFCHTEDLWWKNINQITEVRYVLIAEAPLYGEKRSYIYNPETSGTVFLGLSTVAKLLELLGHQPTVKSKHEMLSKMREIGVVVLDLFPFAFNNVTTYQYGRLSENIRTSLAHSCSFWFLKPKLREIFKKREEHLTFGVRYTRLHSFANGLISSSVPDGISPKVELA